jgi:methionyl-tRNA synthetase
VVYVWIDALSNYITALGYGTNSDARFRQYWPVDVHLIGKEILWFHTVYWPAMLMSLNEALPKKVYAHGWWTSGGRKMSKTMGNFIDLEKLRTVIKTYGQDSLRFYLLRAAPFGHDLDWSDADFLKSFKELGNVLGNLLNRVLKMIGNYRDGKLPAITAPLEDIDRNLQTHIDKLGADLAGAYERCELQHCATLPIELARLTNGYIDATAPFKLAKDPTQSARLDTILHLSAQAIHRCLIALLPILPHKSPEGLRQLGVDINNKTLPKLLASPLPVGHQFNQGSPLFPQVT